MPWQCSIIPQAMCSWHGLHVGAKLSVVVRLLAIVVFPIAYPVSKLLDLLLGKGHSALLKWATLKTLVDMHGNEGYNELDNEQRAQSRTCLFRKPVKYYRPYFGKKFNQMPC
ncbi:unnamed protein product [Camellia sinensis]